jgi:hypothetical protein
MLECKLSFTALLYSMEYRGLASAKRLFAGISPLFRSSGALRDSAFLVLRKLLHRYEVAVEIWICFSVNLILYSVV